MMVVNNTAGTTSRRRRPGAGPAAAVDDPPSSSSSSPVSVAWTEPSSGSSSQKSRTVLKPAYDAEVLGGDTCDLGQCCVNPCGYLCCLLGAFCERHGGPSRFLSEWCLTWQTAYIVVCYGVWASIFLEVYPLLNDSPTGVPPFHKIIGYLVFAACVGSWRYAAGTSPGNITKESLARFDNYHYDNILYSDDNICPTLHIRKLARSKYNRYSDTHVPRFDHHCFVLDQSVGEENYRFFLFFLTVHTSMSWYGFYILCRVMWGEASSKATSSIMTGYYAPPLVPAPAGLAAIVFFNPRLLTILLVLLFACAVVLSVFLAFHCYIVSIGVTTNEYYKWKELSIKQERHRSMGAAGKKDEEAAPAGIAAAAAGGPTTTPRNSYNLGVLANIREMLSPRSQQKKSL
jgi:hypothetical protein